ncbi:MAG: hypothetical protein ACREKN_02865 [Longimicrobiaceae bacterium]
MILPAQLYPETFRTTVHGLVFGGRSDLLRGLGPGATLVLIPDPPGQRNPAVWVHRAEGDPVGHLPPEINAWLVPWMLRGGRASAVALRVSGDETPSWKRLLIEVSVAGRS